MSEPTIARFHSGPMLPSDNDPEAAKAARKRISELPDAYSQHAAPRKEELVGVVEPVSPAAGGGGELHITKSVPAEPVAAAKPAATVTAPAPAQPIPEPRTAKEQAAKHTGTAHKEHSKAKPKRKRRIPGRLKPIVTGLVTFVLLLMLFKIPILLNQFGYLTNKPAKTSTPATQATAQVGPDPVLSIPKINVNAPIVFANSNQEAAIQKDLEGGVVHYANTATPGQPGNSVIFGHSSNDWWEPGNYKFVFVLLDKLVVGDTFTVNYQSKQYVYKVVETKVVEPTDLSVLNQTSQTEMTLITCTPPGTSWKRLIVRAAQVSPEPTQPKTANEATGKDSSGLLPGNSASSITETLGNWWQSVTGFFTGE